jgi:hypothetical protein
MTKHELTQIITQLVTFGEDQAELNFWIDIYDYLEPEQQSELANNLIKELETLKSSAPTG